MRQTFALCCVSVAVLHLASALSRSEKSAIDALCVAIPAACPPSYQDDYCGNLNIIKCKCPGFTSCPSNYQNSSQQIVTEISYSSKNTLSGSLPTELGRLLKLGILSLPEQDIKGTIPSELGLTQLYMLNVRNNKLGGTIPAEVAALGFMGVQLNSNGFSGSIPSTIFNDKLQIFDVHENMFTGSIPSTIGSANKMLICSMSQNRLSGTIPTEIGLCSGLKELDLNTNQLSGPIPSEIGAIPTLTNIALSNNFLSGQIPSELGNLNPGTNGYVILGNNSFSGSIPTELGRLTTLRQLAIYQAPRLSGQLPTEFGRFAAMQYLWLNDNSLFGTIPSQLASATKLVSLRLQNNLLSGTVPRLAPAFTTNSNTTQELYLQGNMLTGSIGSLGLAASVDYNCFSTLMSPLGICSALMCGTSVTEAPSDLSGFGLCYENSRLRGTLTFIPASNETCVSQYNVFLGAGSTNILRIASVPRSLRDENNRVSVTVDVESVSLPRLLVSSSRDSTSTSSNVITLDIATLPTSCDGVLPSSSPIPESPSASLSRGASPSTSPSRSRSPSNSRSPSMSSSPAAPSQTIKEKKKSSNGSSTAIAIAVSIVAVAAIAVVITCFMLRRRSHKSTSRVMVRAHPSKAMYEDADL